MYDAKFQRNVLVAGRTNCGKTFSVQKLAVNDLFRKLNQAESKLLLAKQERVKFNLVLLVYLNFIILKIRMILKTF